MKLLTTLIITAAIAAAGAIGFAYSGFYDVSASSPHGGLAQWLFSTTSRASIERRAKDIAVPDLSDETLLLAGVNDFDAMCAGCHAAPGKSLDSIGQGLNPPAPDLAESAVHMSPAELFWVTKHGIKMTGMPAWGATHEDPALWPVVVFVTMLPDLDAQGYRTLLARSQGIGHHAAGDASRQEHGHSGPHDPNTQRDEDRPPTMNTESHDGHNHNSR